MSALPTQDTQSRPSLHDTSTKQFGLLKKFRPRRGGQQRLPCTTMAHHSSSHRHNHIHFHRNWRAATSPSSSNLMQWLQTDCPLELLPRIMAFAGPKTISTISKTNRFWHDLISQERTWQMLSEDLYKWKEGDEIPTNWKDFYRYNPCVPIDYPSVAMALSTVQSSTLEQAHSIRVLLRPGTYILREPISVQAQTNVEVTVETMQMPDTVDPTMDTSMEPIAPKKRRKSRKLLKYLTCRKVDIDEEEPEPDFSADFRAAASTEMDFEPCSKRAILMLQCHRHNEPLIRVRRGSCTLRNLRLYHASYGIDIWNGNAAVQIQPPVGLDDQPIFVNPAPSVTLDHVEVASGSGRGIVSIDGGHLNIRNCYIHDCAATGIYVGGSGSQAVIENTDVIRNGGGNRRHRRGIPRGHSGIYLEQGLAQISNCNISQNCLTGISAVSPTNAILHLEESDLVSNGAYQLEMPGVGTNAHRHSITRNIHMATHGMIRSRSGLMIPLQDD